MNGEKETPSKDPLVVISVNDLPPNVKSMPASVVYIHGYLKHERSVELGEEMSDPYLNDFVKNYWNEH